jgi:hypothetical protein
MFRVVRYAIGKRRYEGGHWLGTFAVYLTSEAGI